MIKGKLLQNPKFPSRPTSGKVNIVYNQNVNNLQSDSMSQFIIVEEDDQNPDHILREQIQVQQALGYQSETNLRNKKRRLMSAKVYQTDHVYSNNMSGHKRPTSSNMKSLHKKRSEGTYQISDNVQSTTLQEQSSTAYNAQ